MKLLALILCMVLSACAAPMLREVSMLQTVKGKDWIPGKALHAAVDGDYAQLDAGGVSIGGWAFAVYTAPITPHEEPFRVTVNVDNLEGYYYISLYDWNRRTWYNSGPYTAGTTTLYTSSAFWAVHVYGGDSVRVLSGALETQP